MESLLPEEIASSKKSYHKVVLFEGTPDEIHIEGRSADDPTKLVSATLDGVWIDELARCEREAFYGALAQRIGAKNGWMIGTTTPLGRNWAYDEYQKGIVGSSSYNPSYQCFSWKTADNPYFSKAFLAQQKATMPDLYYRREYEASFDAFSGLIYGEFSPERNVLSEAQFRKTLQVSPDYPLVKTNRFKRVVAGCDFGYNDPSVCLVVGELDSGQYVILEEFVQEEMIFNDHRPQVHTFVKELQRIYSRWNIEVFVCDHRPENIYTINELVGYAVKADKRQNTLMPQTQAINGLFKPVEGTPNLHVFDSCKRLIEEMNKYVWDAGWNGLVDQPAKDQSDHCVDAMRYAISYLLKQRDNSVVGSGSRRYCY